MDHFYWDTQFAVCKFILSSISLNRLLSCFMEQFCVIILYSNSVWFWKYYWYNWHIRHIVCSIWLLRGWACTHNSFGDRFFVASPSVCNDLPSDLWQVFICGQFKRQLITYLFSFRMGLQCSVTVCVLSAIKVLYLFVGIIAEGDSTYCNRCYCSIICPSVCMYVHVYEYVCMYVCMYECRLSHSCTLLKPLDRMRCLLAGTLVWSRVTWY